MSWKYSKFSDFIELKRGFDLPIKSIVGGEYPVVSSTSILGYHNEYKVKQPGVTIGRSGIYGAVQYITQNFWPHNTSLYVENFHDNLPKFVYYFLLNFNPDKFKNGAAVPTLNRNNFSNIVVKIPDITTQLKISSILSSYDSLIENNKKQIKLLEEAAQRIYKEWFVDFHFPGYEHVEIIAGVPEGWGEYKIGERFKSVLGGTPSRNKIDYWNKGTIPWINSGKVNELRIISPSEYITELALKESATKLLPIHTTVIAITGATMGKVSYTEIETCANQSVVGIFDSSSTYSAFLFYYIKNNIKLIIGHATGGAQQHINKEIINNHKLILPNEQVALKYSSIIKVIDRKMMVLYMENEYLKEARDRLLPKLMSGEIEIAP